MLPVGAGRPGVLDAVLVAPANTASLRAFLAAGYRPVAAEVPFVP